MIGKRYKLIHRVNYNETDCKNKAFITSIVNYLTNTATEQSESLGVGVDYGKLNKCGWVIYKWDIEIKKLPEYLDKIQIITYPYNLRKFYAYRSFEVLDENDQAIITAKSIWFSLDTEKRKAIRIKEDYYKAYGIEESNDKFELDDIKALQRVDFEKSFNVRYCDIDMNMHVDNVKYIEWAIEAVPKDILLNYSITGLRVTYLKETYFDGMVNVKTQIEKLNDKILCIHRIYNEEGNELTALETDWSL